MLITVVHNYAQLAIFNAKMFKEITFLCIQKIITKSVLSQLEEVIFISFY